MSLECTLKEEGNKLIINLSYPQDSKIDFLFLSRADFEELDIQDTTLIAKLNKDEKLEEILREGVVINSRQVPLEIEHELELEEIKPLQEEILEIEKRLRMKGILPPPKEIEKPLPAYEPTYTQCPECGSKELIEDPNTAEIICSSCGLVIDYKLVSREPEWRVFDEEQRKRKTRVGPPVLSSIHDKGLSTTISSLDRDAYGKKLSLKERQRAYRLRKWQKRIRLQKGERGLVKMLQGLSILKDKLSLPKSVVEEASVIYRKAIKKNLSRGRDLDSLIPAGVYLACRRQGINRPITEILRASIPPGEGFYKWKKAVMRNYRLLRKELGYQVEFLGASQFITRLVNKLNLNSKVSEVAQKIAKAARGAKITAGRNPISIATSAVYIASHLVGEPITQRILADEMGITEVTIRNRYHELWEKLKFVLYL